MKRLAWFLVADNLILEDLGEELHIEGRIDCLDNSYLDVEKHLVVDLTQGRRREKTEKYIYQAVSNGHPLFRYDNCHPHPGHADAHHKHTFDTNGETLKVKRVGEEWPTLGEVLEELAETVQRKALAESEDQREM